MLDHLTFWELGWSSMRNSFSLIAWLLLLGYAGSGRGAPTGTYADWTVQAWGSERTNAASAGKRADPDLDGVPNFLEYAVGLDPTRGDVERFPAWWMDPTNAAPDYRLGYTTVPAAREADLAVLWARSAAGGPWAPPDGVIVADQTNATTTRGRGVPRSPSSSLRV